MLSSDRKPSFAFNSVQLYYGPHPNPMAMLERNEEAVSSHVNTTITKEVLHLTV